MTWIVTCIRLDVVSWTPLCMWAEVTKQVQVYTRERETAESVIWLNFAMGITGPEDKHVPTEVVSNSIHHPGHWCASLLPENVGSTKPEKRHIWWLSSWYPGPLHYFSFIIHLVKSVKCFLKQEVGFPHLNICRHLHRLKLEMLIHRTFYFLYLSKEPKVIFF